MKTLVVCKQCIIENKGNIHKDVEIDDNGIYEFTCEKGHKNVNILQLHSFQILYDLGVMAFLDGYTREAVSNFAVSVERFHKFCIDIFLRELPQEEKDRSWKLIAKQSERQLGVFYYLYLSEFRKTPPSISNNWVSFRNDVIHKGVIPKQEKVLKYAEYVFDYMKELLIELKAKQIEINDIYGFMRRRLTQYRDRKTGLNADTIDAPSFIEIKLPAEHLRQQTFIQCLELFSARMESQSIQGIKRLF